MKKLRIYLPFVLLALTILIFAGCNSVIPSPGATEDVRTISGQIKLPVLCACDLSGEVPVVGDCDETEDWAIIANAVVELKSAQRGSCRRILDTTITDEDGNYQFEDVKPGLYIITAYCADPETHKTDNNLLVKDVAQKIEGIGLDAGIPDCTSTALALVIEKINNCYNDWYRCFGKLTNASIYNLVEKIAKDVNKVDIPAIMAHIDFGEYCDDQYEDLVDLICEWNCCTPSPGATGGGGGGGGGGDDEDPSRPALEVTKTAVQKTYSKINEVIDYNITVKNTGNVTLTNIEVTDPGADAGSITGSPIATLAPDEEATVTAKHTVTQEDLDRGSYKNTATATGEDPQGNKIEDEDDETIDKKADPEPKAKLTVKKLVTPSLTAPVTSFDFEITGPSNLTDTFKLGHNDTKEFNLAPGEYTIKETVPEDWTVVVNGGDNNNPNRITLKDGDDITITFTNTYKDDSTQPKAKLTVEKLVDPAATIAQEFVFGISGPSYPEGHTFYLKEGGTEGFELDQGEYTIEEKVPNGWSVKEIAVKGTDAFKTDGNKVILEVKDEPDITVIFTNMQQTKSIAFEKSADRDTYSKAGEIITYIYKVKNTGNVALTGVKVEELPGFTGKGTAPVPKFKGTENPAGGKEGKLQPEQTAVYEAKYTVVEDDLRQDSIYNQAQGSADGVAPVKDDVTVKSNYIEPKAKLTVKKVVNPAAITAQLFDFTITGKSFSDKFTLKDGESKSFDLTPGEYTIEEALLKDWTVVIDNGEGGILNSHKITLKIEGGKDRTITFTNTYKNSPKPGTLIVEKVVETTLEKLRQFDFTVTGPNGYKEEFKLPYKDSAGQDVYIIELTGLAAGGYTITEKDPGNEWSTTVKVGEEKPIDGRTGTAQLASGETVKVIFTNTYTGGTQPKAKLTVKKVVNPATITVQSFDFEITGESFSKKFTLKDGETEPFELDPGEYTITETAPNGWSVKEIAVKGTAVFKTEGNKVTLKAEGGEDITVIFTNMQQIKSIAFEKSADRDFYSREGEIVTYTYKVTNTGNVALTGVKVTELPGYFTGHGEAPVPVFRYTENPVDGSEGRLEPGQTAVYEAEYTIVDDDLYMDELYNYAQGSADGVAPVAGHATVYLDTDPTGCTKETAWGGNYKGPGKGAWWYYYDTEGPGTQKIYAGQKETDGTVQYVDGKIIIDLGTMKLQEGTETVKVQGYRILPDKKPVPGHFEHKGTELEIPVGSYRYYAIHLDVEVCH